MERNWGEIAKRLEMVHKGGKLIAIVVVAYFCVMGVMLAGLFMVNVTGAGTVFLLGGTGLLLLCSIVLLAGVVIGGIRAWSGIYGLREVRPEYKWLLWLFIANIVLNLLLRSDFLGDLGSLLSGLATEACGVLQIFFLIRATSALMEELSKDELLKLGKRILGIELGYAVLAAAGTLINGKSLESLAIEGTVMNAQGMAAIIFTLLSVLVSLFLAIYLLSYLKRAAKAALEAADKAAAV